MKKYKKYYKFLKTMDKIDIKYMDRSITGLRKFVDAYNEGHKDREEYMETQPRFLSKRILLPLDFINQRRNTIPDYLIEPLSKIAHFMGCRVILREFLDPIYTDVTHRSANIIGQHEEVEICYHILQRCIIDNMRAIPEITKIYQNKNKHLFGKQPNALLLARLKLKDIANELNKIMDSVEPKFNYQNILMKTIENKAIEFYGKLGRTSYSSGYVERKMIKV